MVTVAGACIRAPAKINLRLKVTGRRPDGYHELVTLMLPVTLADELRLDPLDRGLRLTCSDSSLPCDETNLVVRAARAFFKKVGIRRGFAIHLQKNIPVAAGLGGGSSDAAATLRALNSLCGFPLSKRDLAAVAGRLGADVPFFLQQRVCIGRGIGDTLEPLEAWPELWYVIVTPPLAVPTAWVYNELDRLRPWAARTPQEELKLTRREYHYIVDASMKMPQVAADFLENDLEAVTAVRHPVISQIKRRLVALGAAGALMSGSGPSVFALFETREAAARAQRCLCAHQSGRVFLVQQARPWDVVQG